MKSFIVAADAIVHCACGAKVGEPCSGLAPGFVHFSRRMRRLLLTAKATPAERARLEGDILEIIAKEKRRARAEAKRKRGKS